MTEAREDRYFQWPELVFPVRHSRLQLSLDKLNVFCADCGKPTTDLRGDVREYHSCLELEIGGACYGCHCITYGPRFRWYEWGSLVLRAGEGWVAYNHRRQSTARKLFGLLKRYLGAMK